MNKPQLKSADLQPPIPEVLPGQGGAVRTPNCNDVLSGRGGRINSHSGNVHFREMVESLKRDYLDPRTKKLEKARIAARLVATIRRLDPPGKFLKEDPNTGMWVEIGDERAWKKAGQALRESASEIRAEHQAQLQAAAVDSQAKIASSNGSGGRQADPPGPRHRPNPPEREGLARSRVTHEQQQLQNNQQDQHDDDLELNQLRREYMKMKRMQQEQQARMQQFQQSQGNFLNNLGQNQMPFQQQNYLDDGLQSINSGAFSVPLSQGSQQMQQIQQIQQMQQIQQQYMHLQNQANLNYPQSASAFDSQFNTCDKTVSSMSTFDVHSMDMSSLGGYSSFAGNQSFAGNLSQGMLMNSLGNVTAMSRDGMNTASRKSALERKLEKANEAHRLQSATQYEQQQSYPQQETQAFVVPTKKESKASTNIEEQNMQSIRSADFEAIDEDEITEASCKLSNLGFSEMDMTFNSDILSIRSKSAPETRTNVRPPENETKQSESNKAPVTASSIFGQSLGSDSLRKGGFNNSNISMEDFNESFKSMDMGDNRGPIDPDGELPASRKSEKKTTASSSSRRTGRQREPAGGRLPAIQSGIRSSTDAGTTEAAVTPRRGIAKANSMGSSGFGLSNNTLGLSDPLMGDFGISMNSLRSFQSQGSDSSSWLKNYQSMENIGNEKNPWDDECGSASSSMSEISAPRMVTTCRDRR
eukprot:CAMPEP_0201699042 /NCGR_PEP_ID=MMETSP0578-20130828/22071_1 /ASSEMBLY_ACC=CAM_ASM_000663 /TAXON_ID=267565 /ORGANISM="Skeletonema grethea, Strain CCMP 1804" /LENGTH=698 /DNA_ID=CAMNT_0048185709 /DNA_START=103 /DNA_END=2199 /DNA_ORIENTATION=+